MPLTKSTNTLQRDNAVKFQYCLKTMLAAHIVLNDYYKDSRVVRETRFLAKNGWKIRVLALASEPKLEGIGNTGFTDSIQVKLIHLVTKNLPSKRLFHLLKYFEFCLRALPHLLQAKVIHCHDLAPLPLGVFVKILRLGNTKVIYDSHELQSETLYCTSRIQKILTRALERALSPFVDEVFTVSPLIVDYYAKLMRKNPKLLINCPDIASAKLPAKDFKEVFPNLTGKKIFVSVGLLAKGRGISKILNAFTKINPNVAGLIIMGRGPLVSEIQGFSKKYPHIHYMEAVPTEEVVSYLKSADYGVIGAENLCLSHNYSLPNKFFEYISADLPVLSSNIQQLNQIISKYNCGQIYDDTPEALVGAIESLVSCNQSAFLPGIKKIQSEYNWQSCENVLKTTYSSL